MAVEYAEAAFNGEWRRMAASDRGNLLYALADKIEENIDMMADLES
jgi:aldehyde dehydrogenase (NAD+)